MAAPISALELRPHDLVREVSLDAINFYVDELSGIYLPDEFKEANADVPDVKYWKSEDRLRGKFGRFTLDHVKGNDDEEQLDGILLMGTTIGLSGLDRYKDMNSLRHYGLKAKVRDVLEARGLLGQHIKVNPVDYGSTRIGLDESGATNTVNVSGNSYDFGRAKAEGRQVTCEMFGRLLGNEIQVLNTDPEPRENEQITR